jgi:hypothetical protein
MPDVKSNEEKGKSQFRSRVILGEFKTPALVKWLIKIGFVKTERAAGIMLLALTTACFLVAVGLFFFR